MPLEAAGTNCCVGFQEEQLDTQEATNALSTHKGSRVRKGSRWLKVCERQSGWMESDLSSCCGLTVVLGEPITCWQQWGGGYAPSPSGITDIS